MKSLAKPLEGLKQGIEKILEKEEVEGSTVDSLRKLRNAIGIIRQQSADKPMTGPFHFETVDIVGMLRPLTPCLHELETCTEKVETAWKENSTAEGLVELETPISNLMNTINILREKLLGLDIVWVTEEEKKKKRGEEKRKRRRLRN